MRQHIIKGAPERDLFRELLFIACLIFCLTPGKSEAQCVTAGSQVIPDDGILTINFAVSGLTDSDLASPTQGICAVEVDFMHEYLGDLTASLISPSGTVIQLVGAVTTSITPTNLSRWNIRFVPCMTAAAPDGGFAPQWSNEQSWQALTNYSGSYHPYSGCLEDFNTGSANGVWRFVFEDHEILQTGAIARVALIFCNPIGLQCNVCEPNAGVLSPPAISICETEDIETSQILVDFQGNPPPQVLYNYQFILSDGNSIIRSGNAFSYNSISGTFTLCGLSYLSTDEAAVNNLIAAGNYDQLIQAIANGVICAEISSPCTVINVSPQPDTIFMNVILCANESFIFRSRLFPNPGIFYVNIDGVEVCDSVFRLNITSNNLTAIIATPDSISCGSAGVTLNGSMSQGGVGPITYQWSTQAGILNGNLTNSQVTALVPGNYTLTVMDNQCASSTDVSVYGDVTYPQIFMIGDIITCLKPVVTIHPVVFPSNVTYSWTGPGGFASNLRTIDVSVPGRYFLRVVAANGCEAFTYVDITSNTTPPDANILLIDKACAAEFGVIGVRTPGNIYEWGTPGSPAPPNSNIGVSEQGLYTITVTDPGNGCTAVGTFDYIADYAIPPIIIMGIDSLRCSSELTLYITNANYQGPPHWTGPNGQIFGGFNVNITQPGIYYIQVLGDNDCRNSDTIEIFASNEYPSFEIINDTISCKDPLATIGIVAPDADLYHWDNLPFPESENAFLQVNVPGTYFVTAIDTHSGCTIKATARVVSNLLPPNYSFKNDSLSCSEPTGILEFVPVAGNNYDLVQWQFPDMTISTGTSVAVDEIGTYLLTVTGENGCMGSSLLSVISDTILPRFFLEPPVLGCDLQGQIRNIRVDSLIGIQWTGPNGFNSAELEPIVTDIGIYTASAFSKNGCPRIVSTHVRGDFNPPVYSLIVDSLTCADPLAQFVVSSPDSIILFEWTDITGAIVSIDSTAVLTEPGWYYILLERENHCTTVDSVLLDPEDYPFLQTMSDTILCKRPVVTVLAESDTPGTTFSWLDMNGNILGSSDQLDVSDAGPFVISITSPNGCEVRDTILVPIDTIRPFADINIIGEVRCQERDFMLDASASTPLPLQFKWSNIGGIILSADTIPRIDASDTGLFFLDVTHAANGCQDRDSLQITEHPDAITLAFIDIKPPACSGDSNAEILVGSLQGGIPPITFKVDNLPPQTSNILTGFSAGTYLLQISDAAGCLYDTMVTILPTEPYTVDAGPDQEIYIGESANLSGSSDISPDRIFGEAWRLRDTILCVDCTETTVSPLQTSTYIFQLTSITGCVIFDDVQVFVLEQGRYYIPNIFSPNDDGINDVIRLHAGPGIVNVFKWIIYDRWGNAVFSKSNFFPSDDTVFWDGRFQGSEKLNPGVFAYVMEVEILNGNREVYHGSITLIR